MDALWTTALYRKYGTVIDQLEVALRDCPDALWEASLWRVKREHPNVWPVRRVDDERGGKAAEREALLQVYSAFWNIAYHAIFHLDFYLSGGRLKGFAPPPPFREDEHRARVVPNRAYTRPELQRYLAFTREKAAATIRPLTEAQAAAPAPRAGVSFAELLLHNLLHAQDHAAQLSLFLGQHDVEPRGGAAAEQARRFLRDGVRARSDAEIDAFVKSIRGYGVLLPLVLAGLCANIAPRASSTIRFDVGQTFIVRAEPGGAAFTAAAPDALADATVAMSAQDFLRWMTEELSLAAAIAGQRVTIEGDPTALDRLFATDEESA